MTALVCELTLEKTVVLEGPLDQTANNGLLAWQTAIICLETRKLAKVLMNNNYATQWARTMHGWPVWFVRPMEASSRCVQQPTVYLQ